MVKTEAWKTWEGRVVDAKYPLRQWLGGSDHSAVFLTEKLGKPGKSAIKLVEANGGDADREVARLRSAAELSHPNLISIFEAGRGRLDDTQVIYVVMEFAEEDLSQILPERPLTPAEVTDMLSPLMNSLAYLHDKGMVHGRIKPSNVLAVGDQLKLSSDQIAPSGETSQVRRRVGVYDAPEASGGVLSPASDVWSLGVTIVTALTQKPAALPQGSQSDPGLPGGIPEPFRGIARECLHLDPKRRCSLSDIQARLQPMGRSVPAKAETAPPVERDSNRLPVFAIPLVIIVIALAAWGLFHSRDKSSSTPPAETSQPTAPRQTAPQSSPSPAPVPSKPGQPAVKATASGGDILHEVIPDIPQSAKNTISGTIKVVVRADADASGKVTSAKLKSAGSSHYFAGKALAAAEKWEFSPPQVNGAPAPSTWLVTFRFRRGSTQASAQRASR